MSEETPPYQAHGDEALEARIVAWVLGESSPFEAEELKRLCAERPELEIFRRRIDAVHGLLRESEKQGSSIAWQLPSAKRAYLDAVLGTATTPPANVLAPPKRRYRAWLSAAASVAILLALAGLLAPMTMRQRKSASGIAYSLEMRAYETDYPAELIQGTPVPITPESLLSENRSESRPSRNPSSPSSAQANVVSSRGASPTLIHVPEIAAADSSSAFGDSDAFGGGWGGGELAQNGVPTNGDLPVTGRLFSGETDASPPPPPPAGPDGYALSIPSTESAGSIAAADAPRISDYYRAAYDHTRAELLMEVDNAWELAVPVENASQKAKLDPSDQSDLSDLPPPFPADAQALRELNESLEDACFELAKLLRTKAIAYDDFDLGEAATDDVTSDRLARVEAMRKETRDSAIQRGIGAKDITEAKARFEEAQRRLQDAKARLIPGPEKPKPPPPVPSNETSATADPFSTFSLHISDAAFVLARDALRRGERPAAEQIRVEQFYNALDYGDPAPAADEPVATRIEQTAHPVLPGRNLVRIAARVGSTGRAASQPLHLTLLVDQSGSMIRADRRAAMENALNTLTGLLGENDRVHLIGFARQPRLIAEALPGNRASEIPALIHQAAAEGGTNMEAALELAQQISARHQAPGAQNRVVVLSDGAVNLGDADPARLAERITAMRQQGIATDIAGIGSDGLNDALLAELARHGDGRYHVVTPETGDRLARDLAGAFRPAASDVKVQVVFNPERVGGWKLIGFEEHRLNTEDFRNDAVDAAELAAEEAGVAIYQVETLPQGRGQIGEIFIRFRDTTTGQIVERSWPIPYQPNTPALDQARPSMQLATLAMLTAEKLRGGPLGDAIDLTTHHPLIESLRPHFRHDPRANELFEMISQLTGR